MSRSKKAHFASQPGEERSASATSPEQSLRLASQNPAVPVAPAAGARLLTLNEAALRLAISLPTIRSWVWQRKIEIVKIGRCVRIREEVLSRLIFDNIVPPRAKT